MTAAAPVYFACLDCPLLGTTDRTAEQHVRATGHSTLTSGDPARLARMRARVGGEGGEVVAERFMGMLHPELSLYGIDAAREARDQVAALVSIVRETSGGEG